MKKGDLVSIITHNNGANEVFGIIISDGKHHLGKWFDVYLIKDMKFGLFCESEMKLVEDTE